MGIVKYTHGQDISPCGRPGQQGATICRIYILLPPLYFIVRITEDDAGQRDREIGLSPCPFKSHPK